MIHRAPRRLGHLAAAAAATAAAATVLAVGHLVAVLVAPAASPFFVLGATVVDNTPKWLKDSAIRWFGANDKLALAISMAAVMVVTASLLGELARRRFALAAGALTVLGLIVAVLALRRPNATFLFVMPALAGTLAGVAALTVLFVSFSEPEPEPTVGPSRRGFMLALAGVTAGVAAAGVAGRYLATRLRDIAADRAAFLLPRVAKPAPPVSAEMDLPVQGITPFVTDADEFYRVDTALQLPSLTRDEWRLRIHGMVEREIRLDYDELLARDAVESVITLTCVSNEVGGDLLGTARWTGYRLADLLAEAGPSRDADMVLSRSIDGFTASTPLAALTGNQDALLAVAMNGEALPVAHGYPARMIVPGLYGYVSATKWVVDLEVTRFDRAEAYWTRRGWAPTAPIKTASRIDVPAAFATLPAGLVVVAGVAWAQGRGIRAVEVQVDDGAWQQATLAEAYSIDTWRQWTWRWDASPGTHSLRVRATDATGSVQTDERVPPFPDGATGHHSRVVTIR
ncbi:molybdopterin-dependent oxidoreductase [Nocardia rosealba]|uniref:molybdopterin-dependent oxidoreductase n=1 Tax=Nocardia rosealba TaxID=2878563 RepID=UPI001CD98CA7|nr:molybdopterin-dependent oxidoreductase [Nocardia rosealba]MCA2206010.1 molybdopterin-dependent oxidoreductase [Nocardia rosealba]